MVTSNGYKTLAHRALRITAMTIYVLVSCSAFNKIAGMGYVAC